MDMSGSTFLYRNIPSYFRSLVCPFSGYTVLPSGNLCCSSLIPAQQVQNICITFVQRRSNVFDVGPTLYKWYTNVFGLLGEASVTIPNCLCACSFRNETHVIISVLCPKGKCGCRLQYAEVHAVDGEIVLRGWSRTPTIKHMTTEATTS